LISEENISISFGKISKYFADLHSQAFTGYTHPTYTARTGKPTGNQTPGFGSTFTISQITSDGTGHVTAATDRTVKIPDTTMGAASADAAGSKGLVPAPAAGKQTSFLRGDGTWVVPTNTDTKVTQSQTTTTNYRPILFGAKDSTDISTLANTVTDQAYTSTKMFAKPDIGVLYASGFSTSTYINGTGARLNQYGLYLKSYKSASLPAGGNYSYEEYAIRVYDGKSTDNNGMLLTIDGGGLTIVGGGESAKSLAALISDDQRDSNTSRTRLNVGGTLNTAYHGSEEQLILSSDNNIYFLTTCQTIANRKPVVLDVNSYFYPGTTKTGSIGTSSYMWNSVYAATIYENGTSLASKYAAIGHTHNYAGSASAGGAATSANKLNTNDGGTYLPVYFSNGVPVAVTVKNNTSVGTIGWSSGAAANAALVTTNSIAYWNGAYNSTSSNLRYCRYGEIAPWLGNLTTIGSGSPASADSSGGIGAKAFWESANCPTGAMVSLAYNNSGDEYSFIFSKSGDGNPNSYGTVLRWGYPDLYIRILRHWRTEWRANDWEKIYAGYADSAGAVAWSGVSSKPTTLSGYGITDAKISNGTITLGSNTITPLTSHQSVSDKNVTLAWGTQKTIATIGSTDIHVTLPSNPNTNTTYTLGTSGNNVTLTPSSGSVQSITVPYATKATQDGDGNTISSTYLKLSGGTMTGDITFTGVGTSSYPSKSKGIYWSGGTDAIDMYYNLRESDAGELIINMRDDSNVRTSFAYNGTVKSYIDTNGTYNGNATKTGIRWNAVSQGQKWSRLYYSETAVNVEGSNGILSISCTRGNVVVNAVFLVFVSHSGSNASHIIELASTNYSTIRCRVVSNSAGSYYFEIYDTANT
jgi:hypothetical protein